MHSAIIFDRLLRKASFMNIPGVYYLTRFGITCLKRSNYHRVKYRTCIRAIKILGIGGSLTIKNIYASCNEESFKFLKIYEFRIVRNRFDQSADSYFTLFRDGRKANVTADKETCRGKAEALRRSSRH